MNFPTVPTIPEAIIARARASGLRLFFSHGRIFQLPSSAGTKQRNGVTGLTKECIGYENGVLGGVVSALNVFCSKGDNVLLHSPTYIGFTGSLEQQRLQHRPQPAGKRRKRRLAHGF